MKMSNDVTKLLADVAKMPGDQKIKVSLSAIRELAQSDVLNKAAALAAVSILAYLADKTPMAIEERKHVEFVIDAMQQVKRGDAEEIKLAVNALTKIVGYYTEQV